jgi:hypothetical protein
MRTRGVTAKTLLGFVVFSSVFFLAKKRRFARAGIRGTRKGAATRAYGDARGWSRRGTATEEPPRRAPARPRRVFEVKKGKKHPKASPSREFTPRFRG